MTPDTTAFFVAANGMVTLRLMSGYAIALLAILLFGIIVAAVEIRLWWAEKTTILLARFRATQTTVTTADAPPMVGDMRTWSH